MQRPEVWWRNSVLGETGPRRNEAVLWETGAGEPQGYAVFNQSSNEDGNGTVWTREFAALSGDAYLNLITFLAQHDIHREITVVASSDDPLPLLFSDAERLTVKQGYTVLLRIVDVEGALRSRPVADPDLDTELTLEVTDEAAPWNAGTWRVSVESGNVVVDRSDGARRPPARREGAGPSVQRLRDTNQSGGDGHASRFERGCAEARRRLLRASAPAALPGPLLGGFHAQGPGTHPGGAGNRDESRRLATRTAESSATRPCGPRRRGRGPGTGRCGRRRAARRRR